jgi:multidrug efflux pump subunit AcrA (membrane-fusion protein)
MNRKQLILSALGLLAGGLLIWIWLGRGTLEPTGIHRVDADADIPPAAVARAERHNMGSTLSIAGEFKPFQNVDVHAKVAGYIRQIYLDVGDHVKEGQTIAVLEVPELAAQLTGVRNNVARDVRISWQDAHQAFARLTVTQQLREQANLALDPAEQRYNLGLSSIVEFSQAELGKTEADITDTDASYRYRLSQIILAYTVGAPR